MATSKVYIDQYGILYFGALSDTWCSSTPANSMIIFKNNFDMDLWENTINGDYYEQFSAGTCTASGPTSNYFYSPASLSSVLMVAQNNTYQSPFNNFILYL